MVYMNESASGILQHWVTMLNWTVGGNEANTKIGE